MSDKKPLLTAISTVAAASFSLSALAAPDAGSNPFQAQELPAGFQVSADDHEDKDKDEEGSCGEGSCGEGTCGEGQDEEKDDEEKGEEGSCGEGSCGEGSCGTA